jgi:hypothetical protein
MRKRLGRWAALVVLAWTARSGHPVAISPGAAGPARPPGAPTPSPHPSVVAGIGVTFGCTLLESRLPLPDTTTLPRDGALRLRFDRPPAPAGVVVFGEVSGRVPLAFTVEDDTLVATPVRPYAAGERLQVVVTAEAGGADGEPVCGPSTWWLDVATAPIDLPQLPYHPPDWARTDFDLADFDADGRVDIVLASAQMYLQDSLRSFTRRDIRAADEWYDVTAGDVDGDSLPDLVVTENTSTDDELLRLYRGAGRGGAILDPAADRAVGIIWYDSIDLHDLDGDGALDLITERGVLDGLGDGRFDHATIPVSFADVDPSPDIQDLHKLEVNDINHDGRADLIWAQEQHTTAWLAIDGGWSPVQTDVSPNGRDIYAGRIGDVDGDGEVDVVFTVENALPADDRLYLARGNGTGAFLTTETIATVRRGIPVLADVDSDGKDEIFLQGLIVEDVDGQIVERPGPPWIFEAGADLDGDGAEDLIGESGVLGSGARMIPEVAVPHEGRIPADTDGDGWIDLIALEPGARWAATGPFTWSDTSEPIVVPQAAVGPWGAGDVNGDGRMDLVATLTGSPSGYLVQVFVSDAAGVPVASWSRRTTGEADAFRPVDINLDGHLDLVWLEHTRESGTDVDDAARVAIGRGDGTFATPYEVPLGGVPSDLDVVDADNDGWPDFITPMCFPTETRVHYGPIVANSTPPRTAVDTEWVSSRALARDLDGDQRPDLVFVPVFDEIKTSYNVVVAWSNGPRRWTLEGDDNVGAPSCVDRLDEERNNRTELRDVTGDGRYDLVWMHGTRNDVYDGPFELDITYATAWRPGRGANGFAPPEARATDNRGPLYWRDMDRDGVIDLLSEQDGVMTGWTGQR